MPALRFFGGLFLLLGVAILIADLTNARWAWSSGLTVPLARHWASLAPSSLAAAQKSLQVTSALLWDPVVKSLLKIPAWTWFCLIGGVMAWTGRRRRRVNIFLN